MKRIFYFGLLFLLTMTVRGGSATAWEPVLRKANQAYTAGAFAEAAELYQKVAAAGYESAELYYNLGNAFFKQQDFTRAILWYERAKRLDPANEDIDFNLNVANTRIADKIEPLPELFYKRWYNGLVRLMPVDTWALAGSVLFLAALFGLVLFTVSRVLILRKAGFWMAVTLIFFSLVTFLLAWSGYSFSNSTREAILITPTITVKSSPDEKGTDLFVLHEGAKVRLMDHIGEWYEIRIANGSVGWLPKNSLEAI